MASEIYYMPAGQTLDAAAIGNGRVIEKILITSVDSTLTIKLFGPNVKTWVTSAWAASEAGTDFTIAAGQIIEGPFTKAATPTGVTAVAYLK